MVFTTCSITQTNEVAWKTSIKVVWYSYGFYRIFYNSDKQYHIFYNSDKLSPLEDILFGRSRMVFTTFSITHSKEASYPCQ